MSASITIHPQTYRRVSTHELVTMWISRGYTLTNKPRSNHLHVRPLAHVSNVVKHPTIQWLQEIENEQTRA